jgi:U2 small nuclear ribonucleoprotein A'
MCLRSSFAVSRTCVTVVDWNCLMNLNCTLYFRRIAEGLELCLPNLETLVLTGNLILELADLDPLANIKSLRTLSLLHNPVTTRQHYRLYVTFRLPQIRLLDFRKIKMKVSDFCKI